MKTVLLALTLLCASSVMAKDITGPRDQFGNHFNLSSWGEDRLAVVAFLGVECPLGGLYSNRLNELHSKYASQGVCFVAVNSNQHDTYEGMCDFAKGLNFTMLKDDGNVVADEFGATRSPEVFLLDAGREVIYKGRIDDQYAPGNHSHTEPTRSDLEEAIKEALSFAPVSVPTTIATGCHIDRIAPIAHVASTLPTVQEVNYSKHIAPIFDAKCAECHRAGEVAPFPLLTYADAVAWTGTIKDVIVSKRMPPWSAGPNADGVHFSNDRSLTEAQRALILSWIDAGAPEGNPADRPALPKFVSGWTFQPDVIVKMPSAFTVPKEGVLDYQVFEIDPGFSQDTWISAIEIRPGNRKVVHHATVYVKPKHASKGMFFFDKHDDNYLGMYVPGNTAMILPNGAAKLVPAGWTLHLSVHYVPNGTEQTDQTSVALKIATDPVLHMATRIATTADLSLQPGEIKTVKVELKLDEDYLLTALFPHMHLRGKSMVFQAFYPNGSVQTLLSVPDYDFEWQHRYVLEKAIVIPAGTTLRCTAVYDNSSANPRNPDPTVVVRAGEGTMDEMLMGIFELGHPRETNEQPSLALVYAAVAISGVFVVTRRKS